MLLDFLLTGQVLVATAAAFAVAAVGGGLAARLGQPPIAGEIVAALAAGPVLLAWLGRDVFAALWSPAVQSTATWVGEAGLVLYLFGLSHGALPTRSSAGRRTLAWVAVCGWLPAALGGALLAGWLLIFGPASWRGSAPAAALVLLLAVALSITAVPVLARILTDTGTEQTVAGRLSFCAAILMDGVGWVLLTIAAGFAMGGADGVVRMGMLVLQLGLVTAALGWVLRRRITERQLAARPLLARVVLAVVVVSAALAFGEAGLSPVIGAFVLGLAVPSAGPSEGTTRALGKVGAPLVPLFVIATCTAVVSIDRLQVPWLLVGAVLVIGTTTKVAGGFIGGRLGGLTPADSTRIGLLLNTRGLTEVAVLQVGVASGILSAELFVAGLVLAVVSTLATHPLLRTFEKSRHARQLSSRAAVAQPPTKRVPATH